MSTGFNGNNREAKLFDLRKGLDSTQASLSVDSTSSSALFSAVDEDLRLAYVWGKGDGNIRIYDLATGLLECTELKSNVAQSGVALLPKHALSAKDVKDGAVGVLYKLTTSFIDVIQVLMPRAGTSFFDKELHPDTWDGKSRQECDAFIGGSSLSEPLKISLDPEVRK